MRFWWDAGLSIITIHRTEVTAARIQECNQHFLHLGLAGFTVCYSSSLLHLPLSFYHTGISPVCCCSTISLWKIALTLPTLHPCRSTWYSMFSNHTKSNAVFCFMSHTVFIAEKCLVNQSWYHLTWPVGKLIIPCHFCPGNTELILWYYHTVPVSVLKIKMLLLHIFLRTTVL